MQLVERHIICSTHQLFKECDDLAFKAKNLYNQGLYRIRQHFFKTEKYLNYRTLQKQLQEEKQVDYVALPAKVSQQVLRGLDKNFVSFFKANQAYLKSQSTKSKFKSKPKIPKYKKKFEGRSVVTYTNQAISKVGLRDGLIQPSKTTISLSTKQTVVRQVRIAPKSSHYVIEVIYNKAEKQHIPNNKIAAIDLGLNNLATTTFNFKEEPVIINGRPLKSINQFYNKEKAKAMSYIGGKGSSNKTKKLDFKRNNKINDYLHNSSHWLINHLVSLNVSTLVIGWNKGMKQDISLGKKNNQNFVNIPFHKFIHQLQYKGQLEGIKIIIREESYTSKCSFLDGESIKKQETYKGKRIKRGLFRTAKGNYINADINASYNIMSKEFPNAFSKLAEGIEGVVVNPMRINPYKKAA